MKVYKFSVFLFSVTLLALLYVHQQVQLVKISYQIELNEKKVISFLDQNKILVYNMTTLKSPVYLEEKFLASKRDFRIPQQSQVVEAITIKKEKPPVIIAKTQKRSFEIFRIFGKPKEALANSVK